MFNDFQRFSSIINDSWCPEVTRECRGVSGSRGRPRGRFGSQRRNIRPFYSIDLGALVGASQPSFAAGVLLLLRVPLAIFRTLSAECGVPLGIFFAQIPLSVGGIWGARRAGFLKQNNRFGICHLWPRFAAFWAAIKWRFRFPNRPYFSRAHPQDYVS